MNELELTGYLSPGTELLETEGAARGKGSLPGRVAPPRPAPPHASAVALDNSARGVMGFIHPEEGCEPELNSTFMYTKLSGLKRCF